MTETDFETFLRALEQTPEPDRTKVLGDEYLVYPPSTDFGYDATLRNALTFGAMGVDGVHYAILKLDGQVTNDSPVIQISPMDLDQPYTVLGDSFTAYLTAACNVWLEAMKTVLEQERAGQETLIPFLASHFQHSRLFTGDRTKILENYLMLVVAKS